MSKRKIKIRYIVILPVLICALIFIRKIMKLNDLDAKEVAEIILVSPPYKKRITDQQEIEEFTRMFNNKKRDLCSRSSIRADGVKEPLYQWEHANMTSFSVGRILR